MLKFEIGKIPIPATKTVNVPPIHISTPTNHNWGAGALSGSTIQQFNDSTVQQDAGTCTQNRNSSQNLTQPATCNLEQFTNHNLDRLRPQRSKHKKRETLFRISPFYFHPEQQRLPGVGFLLHKHHFVGSSEAAGCHAIKVDTA